MCAFGCPCCGPLPRSSQFSVDSVARPVPETVCAFERRSLSMQCAEVDGSRDAPYVDTHVHLEMVLQRCIWYEHSPSLLVPSWQHLTEEEQRCWKLLGFTPSVWHIFGQKTRNPTWFKRWDVISDAERAAAEALGWDAPQWNGFHWLLSEDVLWRDLDETTRTHLGVLGETCISWDDMWDKRKPAGFCDAGDMRKWEDLSLMEQRAATQLGYSPSVWDMVELADVHAYIRDFCGSGFEACITQGCDGDSIDDCVMLALAHPQVYATFGCHPKNAWLYEEDNMEERILAAFDKCGRKAVAWGEFGLDLSNSKWWNDPEYRNTQFENFEHQLGLAIKKELPLVLHIRDAADDAMRILLKCVPRGWKAHIHAFHGPSKFVSEIMATFPNFYFGITGTVSMGGVGYEGDGSRMARLVPLDRMLLETDGPYMVPRGSIFNHVGQIPLIARLVAEARGCSADDVLKKSRENSRFLYGI